MRNQGAPSAIGGLQSTNQQLADISARLASQQHPTDRSKGRKDGQLGLEGIGGNPSSLPTRDRMHPATGGTWHHPLAFSGKKKPVWTSLHPRFPHNPAREDLGLGSPAM